MADGAAITWPRNWTSARPRLGRATPARSSLWARLPLRPRGGGRSPALDRPGPGPPGAARPGGAAALRLRRAPRPAGDPRPGRGPAAAGPAASTSSARPSRFGEGGARLGAAQHGAHQGEAADHQRPGRGLRARRRRSRSSVGGLRAVLAGFREEGEARADRAIAGQAAGVVRARVGGDVPVQGRVAADHRVAGIGHLPDGALQAGEAVDRVGGVRALGQSSGHSSPAADLGDLGLGQLAARR